GQGALIVRGSPRSLAGEPDSTVLPGLVPQSLKLPAGGGGDGLHWLSQQRGTSMNGQLRDGISGMGAPAAGPVLLAARASGAGAEERQPLKRVGTIQLKGASGPLDHLLVDAKHARLFVANQSNDTLDVVDLKTNKLLKQIPGQKEIHGIAYVPDLDRIFVGN